jgi:hypothetical protein
MCMCHITGGTFNICGDTVGDILPVMGILESSNNGLELGLQTTDSEDAMGGDVCPVLGTWGSNSIGLDTWWSGFHMESL